MGWVDESDNQISNIFESNIATIETLTIGCLNFKFSKLTDFDNTSIMIRIQNQLDQELFNPFELAEMLNGHGIPYKLTWIPQAYLSPLTNLQQLISIAYISI